MRLISTDEMVFNGPGSEWFWTAVSGVVLAVTFFAIYRQLALARSENAFTQLNALVDEWQGERLVRKRLAILIAMQDGKVPPDIPAAQSAAIANYWEKVAALSRAGHVSPALIAEGLGAADDWWGILAPWVSKVRTDDGNPELFEHFEWLAGTMVRLHPQLAFDRERFEQTLETRVASTEADLRDLEAMRTSTPASPARTRRPAAK
jgi:hypothetical protein